MYAVVATGGKQYKVSEGDVVRIEKIAGNVGDAVTLDRVLMLSDGDSVSLGAPLLENAAVNAKIVEQARSKKVLVFKYKRRKRFRSKKGHRQSFTAVKIDSITTQ